MQLELMLSLLHSIVIENIEEAPQTKSLPADLKRPGAGIGFLRKTMQIAP